MAKTKEFINEDGLIDFAAYYQAEVEAGERCCRCKVALDTPPITGLNAKHLCCSCLDLYMDYGPVASYAFIRCPRCGNVEDMAKQSDAVRFTAGRHKIAGSCGHTFVVDTEVWPVHISFSCEQLQKPSCTTCEDGQTQTDTSVICQCKAMMDDNDLIAPNFEGGFVCSLWKPKKS